MKCSTDSVTMDWRGLMTYHSYDLGEFEKTANHLDNARIVFVVKSQNQIQRRADMLAGRKKGRFGRTSERPVDTGLYCLCRFKNGNIEIESVCEYREPRHICRYDADTFLLTEMSSLLHIRIDGKAFRRIDNPFFSFLHTVDVSSDGRYALVTSPGYDVVLEIDLSTEQSNFEWFAWEHGFNPSREGLWLAARKTIYDTYLQEGKKAMFIDPDEYGEKGVHTAYRTVHPHIAIYNPYDDGSSIIVAFGHQGEIYKIERRTKKMEKVFEVGSQMPHGLKPYKGGWCIADTTRGEWIVLDRNFSIVEKYITKNLGGKVEGTEDVEWLQHAYPFDDQFIIFIDANRGVIVLDRDSKKYSVYDPDPNWCIQDVLLID